MIDPKIHRNCILTIASRIANEQPVSESQARDFCYAIAEHFSSFEVQREDEDEGRKKTFKMVADVTRRVVEELGQPPGYKHKYESGTEDDRRRLNVRIDYETARKHYGMDSKLDALWK